MDEYRRSGATKSPEVAGILSKVFGREIKYDPCTPEEFGDLLVAAVESMPEEMRKPYSEGIAAFYRYNNSSPTQPFKVNTDYMQERLPEIEFETMYDWAMRQDWSDEAHRPSGG